MEIHPLAALIPAMTPDELEKLTADIGHNGLLDPIVLFEGKILDGRHRAQACEESGVTPRFVEFAGKDPLDFVIAKNLHRRHLSTTQKAMLAAELLPLLEAQARERQQQAGGDHGNQYSGSAKVAVSQKIDKAANREQTGADAVINEEPIESVNTRQNQRRASAQAAELTGSNRQYVSDAKKITAQAPDVAEVAKQGQIAMPLAKKLAAVPDGPRQAITPSVVAATQKGTQAGLREAKAIIRRAHDTGGVPETSATSTSPEPSEPSDQFTIHAGPLSDALTDLAPQSVDWVITDPPYREQDLSVYAELAKVAAHALKPAGLALIMIGQYHLPTVLSALAPALEYRWMAAYLTPGGQAVQVFPRKINTFWKPVLIMGLPGQAYPGPWFGDVTKSKINDNDKRFHAWGQSFSGMHDLMRRFVKPDQIVLDPFCGGGTTGAVALALEASFVGYEIDSSTARLAETRLQAVVRERGDHVATAN